MKTPSVNPVNPVCAVGSVLTAVLLLFVFIFVGALILFSLGLSTKNWYHFPRVFAWACHAYLIVFLAVRLYPKCMKARLARRARRASRLDRKCLIGLSAVLIIFTGAASLYWVPRPAPPVLSPCSAHAAGNPWCGP
jgi:hypothetical protein